MRENHIKAVAIGNLGFFGGPIVVAENLFINVAEQMERFDANVGSFESTLEQAPEVLKAIGVNLSIDVPNGMVNNLVLESFVIESLIRHEIVCINRTALLHSGEHFGLQVLFAPPLNDGGAYFFGLAVKNADNRNFPADSVASDETATANRIHEAGSAANEGFVYFDFMAPTAKFHQRLSLHGKSDAMEHEPCRLLSDAEIAPQFVGANPILAVSNHPDGDKPFVQRDRRILKDSPDLHAELPMVVDCLALPFVLICKEYNVLTPTSGAFDAIGPPNRDHVSEAVSRFSEELNCVLKCFGCLHDVNRLQN